MITAPNVRDIHPGRSNWGKTVPDSDREKKLEDARTLLESATLLETVAAEREAKVEELLESLAGNGMAPKQLAQGLDISESSVKSLLNGDEPKPVHERLGISQETVSKLDPLAKGTGETGTGS